MANIKSQIKRNRQNEKRRLRNRAFRGAARAAVKDARTALEGKTESTASVMAAISLLDKAAQKGAIHPRNAARRKGRLMKQLAAMAAGPKAAVVEPAAPRVEKKDVEKKPAKPVKEEKPAKETKTEAATSSPQGKKPAAKKTSEKKPAEKKPAKKPAGKK